jgi:hypothetical protein
MPNSSVDSNLEPLEDSTPEPLEDSTPEPLEDSTPEPLNDKSSADPSLETVLELVADDV